MVKLILIPLIFLLSYGINKPFIGHHDWNGVFYGNIARNYLRLGLNGTKLGQVTDFGVIVQPTGFYTHYPPLFPLVMAGFFKIFGVSDETARLVPLVFTAGSLWLLVKLFNRLKFKPAAQVGGLAVGLTPMWRYFSLMPSQEAAILFFSLLSLVMFLEGKKKKFFLAVILNGLSGWAGYFLYPWLFLLKKNRSWLAQAGIILVVIFLLHLLHTYWLTGSATGGGLVEALKLRLNLNPPENFSWWGYAVLEKQRLAAFYTLTLLSVAALGTLWSKDKLIWALLGWGLAYPLVFSNVVFVHDYFNIFFIPWLALSSAWFFNRIKRGAWPLAVIFLVLVFFERKNFYEALKATDSFWQGYSLGMEIKKNTPPEETAYVIAGKEFLESQNLFVSYYADRRVEYLTPQEPLPEAAKTVFNLY